MTLSFLLLDLRFFVLFFHTNNVEGCVQDYSGQDQVLSIPFFTSFKAYMFSFRPFSLLGIKCRHKNVGFVTTKINHEKVCSAASTFFKNPA